MKTLFICKNRSRPGYTEGSYGLINSASFVATAISGVFQTVVDIAIDGNDVNRLIHKHRPDTVIIEALWVTPEKMEVLKKLHKNIRWIVRIHSKIPFLANEGIAIDWIKKLYKLGIEIAANNIDTVKDLQSMYIDCLYLPNIYNLPNTFQPRSYNKHHVDIGCFGALRPMKNHLIQAIAAISFAESIGKKLCFHINASRCEQNGESVLKNLRALFRDTPHSLCESPWLNHSQFRQLAGNMQIGMQVSYSESFNIVAADFISKNIPVVASSEISFVTSWSHANPNSTTDIKNKLWRAYYFPDILCSINRTNLKYHNDEAFAEWVSCL